MDENERTKIKSRLLMPGKRYYIYYDPEWTIFELKICISRVTKIPRRKLVVLIGKQIPSRRRGLWTFTRRQLDYIHCVKDF